MPRPTYTPEEKANALIHLHMNGGDIAYTAKQLGISERTLFYWRRKWYAENLQQQSPPPQIQRPDFDNDLEALAYLRKQIMAELLDMADTFRQGTIFATPTQRIHLLSQLLDRLMKLDQHLRPYRPHPPIRFTWHPGLYLRTEAGYRGPYGPQDLPKDWREKYGPSTRLEIYWGDETFTLVPEGDFMEQLLDVRDFNAEHCDLAPSPEGEEYGMFYG